MGTTPESSQDTARSDIKVHCAVIKYLSDYRKPFLFDSIINSMVEDGVLLESEKAEAEDVLNCLYGKGLIIPRIYGNGGELKLIFRLDIEDEILHYLKTNGSRETIDVLVETMDEDRAYCEEETKSAILDLVFARKIALDADGQACYILKTD
jgi:hypothetical protein